ncbi:hypothetical protein EDB81DRAFT_939421 [Dactylonectria macrodidyma]|uniref:Uncharacterized protein n=1 Tax=Dactylonectria macrodidyma TaxID=307937 RepID=A0A9P9JQD2_9HYPO|nr:hypothetical protein EDB81DRAFT_939421 [Dactylonectria macrodidyma]
MSEAVASRHSSIACDDSRIPAPDAKADFVRWEIDLTQPSGSKVRDPLVVLDVPSEFPRIGERFMTQPINHVFLNVFIPFRSDGSKNIFHGLNGNWVDASSLGEWVNLVREVPEVRISNKGALEPLG